MVDRINHNSNLAVTLHIMDVKDESQVRMVRWGAYGWRVCYNKDGTLLSAYELFNDTPADLNAAVDTWVYLGGFGGLELKDYLSKLGYVE